MKSILKTYGLLILLGVLAVSCDLEEEPPYLTEDSIYTETNGAQAALNGILNSMANYNMYAADFHHLTDFTSGLFISGLAANRTDIAALAPTSSQNYPTNTWAQLYTAVARANDMIANISEDTDDLELLNKLGVAYFLRAHCYLQLVRIYGGVPLRTAPASETSLHVGRATVTEVYDQIISDGTKAKELMFDLGEQQAGLPAKWAANVLLAKAYMTLAGDDNGSSYWQLAYNEAIAVYGKYSLVDDYIDLWSVENSANNTSESIFEIQFNIENPSSLVRLFTPGNAYPGPGWSRIRPNPETIDMHMDRYPGDPRIAGTFVTSYTNTTGGTTKVYPESARASLFNGFPYLYKYFVKDQTQSSYATNFNYVVYRYADLLLMLAEIENELNGPANAYTYVNEVLTRARNSNGGGVEPANWSGMDQDQFRSEIMREYQYELLGEGHDFFVGRRRGYTYFKENYIDVHNARNDKSFDIVYPDDSKIMLMPIPSDEINSNQMIQTSDQNPGY